MGGTGFSDPGFKDMVAQLMELQGSSGLNTEALPASVLDELVSQMGGDGAFGSGTVEGLEAVETVETELTGTSGVSDAADAGTVPTGGCETDADCALGQKCNP